MPLDIPLVPVNTDVKNAALSALVQSIGDLQKFQSTPAAVAGQTKAQSDAEKKEEDAARKAAARKVLDEKLPGQPSSATAIAPSTTLTTPRMSGLQQTEQGITGIVGTEDVNGNRIPVKTIQPGASDGSFSVLPAY
jgi:hypothetical protein